MSAPLSVVIPTLNVEQSIGPTLAGLGDALFEGLIREVIFADGGSTDATREIAEATGAVFVDAEKGRGPQLRAGCAEAKGAWLLILHADTLLPDGWTEAVRRHMAAAPDRAGYFRLRFDSNAAMAHVTAGWANLRSRLFALPYGDQGLLISRQLYNKVGGFEPLPLMEDVRLVLTLGRRRLRGMPATVTTSAERYRRSGWIRRGTRNIATLLAWRFGISAERLARFYGRR